MATCIASSTVAPKDRVKHRMPFSDVFSLFQQDQGTPMQMSKFASDETPIARAKRAWGSPQ